MKFDRLAPHYDWMEALLAGDRLQRDAWKSKDLFQRLLEVPEQFEVALHLMIGLERMRQRKAWRAGQLFVDARIVLHGAGAERIEAASIA